jgi:hypothetical protein
MRPRAWSPARVLIQLSPSTNSGAMAAPNRKRASIQPGMLYRYCNGSTEAVASSRQPNITLRRPSRSASAGAAMVASTPPSALAAIVQPITSGLKPRVVRVRAVSGMVLPSPSPSRATLNMTAVKSRHALRGSMKAASTRACCFGTQHWRHGCTKTGYGPSLAGPQSVCWFSEGWRLGPAGRHGWARIMPS